MGILSGYLISYLFIDDVGGWRSMYGLSVWPAIALLLGMVSISPHKLSPLCWTPVWHVEAEGSSQQIHQHVLDENCISMRSHSHSYCKPSWDHQGEQHGGGGRGPFQQGCDRLVTASQWGLPFACSYGCQNRHDGSPFLEQGNKLLRTLFKGWEGRQQTHRLFQLNFKASAQNLETVRRAQV